MSWQIILGISSILGIIRDSFTKRITQKIDPLVALFYFYITAILAATAVSVLYYHSNPFQITEQYWWARLFGIGFGIGVYGYFSAIKISLVKTQTYANYRNFVSIALSYAVLGELKQINVFSLTALLIFVISILLPTIKNARTKEEVAEQREWVFWMLLNILFVGSGLFFVKMFAGSLLSIDLLVNQYVGSFFIITAILLARRYFTKVFGAPLSIIVTDLPTLKLTLINGIITALSLFTLYESIYRSQVSIITQVDNFLRTILIIPIGIFIFKEHKTLKAVDYWSILLALLGAALLLFFS